MVPPLTDRNPGYVGRARKHYQTAGLYPVSNPWYLPLGLIEPISTRVVLTGERGNFRHPANIRLAHR